LHCLLLHSSYTGCHLAYLHCLLLVRRRESLQQMSTWHVCIVCFTRSSEKVSVTFGVSALSANSFVRDNVCCLQQVSTWLVSIVCLRFIERQCLQQMSMGRDCIFLLLPSCETVCCLQQVNTCLHCLLLPSCDTGSATGELLAYLHSLQLVRQRENLQQVSR
jgi:hypothetical protein